MWKVTDSLTAFYEAQDNPINREKREEGE